jgi:tRNA threonylcarbamoyladenosine biosynthesis protein TsaB
LDARMGQIYHAAYEKGLDEWQPVAEASLCFPGNAPLVGGNNWTGCGSGFDMYDNVLRARYEGSIKHIIGRIRPHARSIAQLAMAKFAKGKGITAAEAAPLYIRNKVALKENER